MRKRYLLGVVAGVLGLALATSTSLATSQFNQTVKYKYLKASGKTLKKQKKPAGFSSSLTADDPGDPSGNWKAPDKVTLTFKGAKVDFKGAHLCTLPASAAASCGDSAAGGNPDSKVGTGNATANVASGGVVAPALKGVSNNVVAYARDGGIYLVVTGSSLPTAIILNASLSSKGKLTVNVKDDFPPSFTQLGLKVILTHFDLKLDLQKRRVKGKTHSLLKTPKCGKSKRWKIITKWNYDDGTKESITKRIKCTRPSS